MKMATKTKICLAAALLTAKLATAQVPFPWNLGSLEMSKNPATGRSLGNGAWLTGAYGKDKESSWKRGGLFFNLTQEHTSWALEVNQVLDGPADLNAQVSAHSGPVAIGAGVNAPGINKGGINALAARLGAMYEKALEHFGFRATAGMGSSGLEGSADISFNGTGTTVSVSGGKQNIYFGFDQALGKYVLFAGVGNDQLGKSIEVGVFGSLTEAYWYTLSVYGAETAIEIQVRLGMNW